MIDLQKLEAPHGPLLRHLRIPQARVIRSTTPISPFGGMLRAGFTAAMAAFRLAATRHGAAEARAMDQRHIRRPNEAAGRLRWAEGLAADSQSAPGHPQCRDFPWVQFFFWRRALRHQCRPSRTV